jgi:hypothetical protein
VVQPRGAAPRAKGAQRSRTSTSVTIELTQSQIRSVFVDGGASGTGDDLVSRLGGDVATLRDLIESAGSERSPKLSHSLLYGLYVLASLPDDGGPIGIHELAKRVDGSPSTVHRYLQSLLLAGLAQRDESTRAYSLTFPVATPPSACDPA